jgi:hypothetical protein
MKRNTLLILAFFASICFLTVGCAPQPKMYYWGNYSRSLYYCKKDQSEEILLKHKQELENIIETSKTMSLRIPPGVCAELGYIYFKQNNETLALQYFDMEESIYPESKILMTRYKQAIAIRQKKDAPNKTESDIKTNKINESSEPGIKKNE